MTASRAVPDLFAVDARSIDGETVVALHGELDVSSQQAFVGATVLGLEEAHRELHISPAEFDEVAAELGRTLDVVGVPDEEKAEVLAAFAAHRAK